MLNFSHIYKKLKGINLAEQNRASNVKIKRGIRNENKTILLFG